VESNYNRYSKYINHRLVTGSNDRTIHIYKLEYINSLEYGRNVFGDCILENVIED
jgi:hypothetical protein